MTSTSFAKLFDKIVDEVTTVIRGKEEVVRLSLSCLLAQGHLLIEDLPGTGKTMLCRTLARVFDLSYARVQCTPDLLPSDITGSHMLERKSGRLEFRRGPIFASIVLADEINRATPKTQSALLEAMQERSVTADSTTHVLPDPFFVLATQNPLEQAGTFPLPEAQLDRFLFRLSVGHLDKAGELDVLERHGYSDGLDDVVTVANAADIKAMSLCASKVTIADSVRSYLVDVVHATRADPAVAVGGSTRAVLGLARASRVVAASQSRSEVLPDDLNLLFEPVLAHRLVLRPEAALRDETPASVVARVCSSVRPTLSR